MIYQTYSEAVRNGGLFYFGKPCSIHDDWKRSVNSRKCCKCHSEAVLKARDPDTHRKKSLESYHRNKEKNKVKRAIARRSLYESNRQAIADYAKQWQKNNNGRVKAIKARRRAALLMATPEWARSGEIWRRLVLVYESCPSGLEVDHIVPLQGKDVCGLHVPWNLQYLTKSENSSKGNRLTIDN